MSDSTKKEAERLVFLKICFEIFQKQMAVDGVEISYNEPLDKICKDINTYYWGFIGVIKEEKYLVGKDNAGIPTSTNANIYKIISATEFSIIRLQPIRDSRELNARLTFFIAFSYYRWWFRKEIPNDNFLKKDTIGKIWEKFTEDRIVWFMNIDETQNFPFFLNSQLWMLIDMLTRGKTDL